MHRPRRPKTPQDAPKTPPDAPRCPKTPPIHPQDAPRHPKRPQYALRHHFTPVDPQDAPKTPNKTRIRLQDAHKTPQDGPRRPQDAPPPVQPAHPTTCNDATTNSRPSRPSAAAAAPPQQQQQIRTCAPQTKTKTEDNIPCNGLTFILWYSVNFLCIFSATDSHSCSMTPYGVICKSSIYVNAQYLGVCAIYMYVYKNEI